MDSNGHVWSRLTNFQLVSTVFDQTWNPPRQPTKGRLAGNAVSRKTVLQYKTNNTEQYLQKTMNRKVTAI